MAAKASSVHSVIEHVARICSLHSWEEVLMVMLTVALDVSEPQPNRTFLVMAGFVSSAEQWAEFDRAWCQRLREDGLTYFQMRAFAHSDHEFKVGWRGNETRRQKLLRDLLEIITEHVYQKFAVVIQADAFDAISEDASSYFRTMIAAAGKFIASQVYHWRDREGYRDNPRFIFEDGDRDKGTLMDAMKEITGRTPGFEQKKDDPSRGIVAFTPLQAADILAYEVKQVADEVGRLLPDDFRFRFPYEQLDKIHGEPAIFTMSSVAAAEAIVKINRHFEENPLGQKD